MKTLNELFLAWTAWAKTADRSEDGWQSDFPEWTELVDAAWVVQCNADAAPEALATVEEIWAISSESEDMLSRQERSWVRLQTLGMSRFSDCRWQIYDVAGSMAAQASALLRQGLNDTNSYARRRAILTLARLQPPDARALAIPLLTDPDPYIRQAAIELVLVSDDEGFRTTSLQGLALDPVDHVRAAAASALARTSTRAST